MIAYRISSQCPKCRGELVMRRNKAKGNLFLGCSLYPLCDFTEPVEPIVTELGRHKAELEEAQKHGIDSQSAMLAQMKLKRAEQEVASLKSQLRLTELLLSAERLQSRLGGQPINTDEISRRILRVIAALHPDRWDNAPASVEATKQLNDLREYVQKGK